MTAPAYYNENDPYCAAWLRNLIAKGLIPPGNVDERSISDVSAADVSPYRGQCHFFAGIGGWALAARLAGWPDDGALWTGSCPCQPFSCAGQKRGFTDDRDLWPAFHHLIRQHRPRVVVGEQTASRAGRIWWDRLADDMEQGGYAVAAVDLPALAVAAPQLRQRLWFVACTDRIPPFGTPVAREKPAPWPSEPAVARVAHGLPPRMDRVRAGLGNAIVPQLGAQILRVLMEARP